MKKPNLYILAAPLLSMVVGAGAHAQEDPVEGHVYLGGSLTALALDSGRVPGEATSSPGHAPKIASLMLGYQFDKNWAADISLGTNLDGVDTDAIVANAYRYIGSSKWKPYVSAGLSTFSVDQGENDSTTQGQVGLGVSGALNRNLELRVGYQRFFHLGDESYGDNAYGLALAYHFRKPVQVAAAEPVAEPPKEEIERVELIVQFDFDSSDVRATYGPQFTTIAQVLKDNPELDMTIEGHTCWLGPEEYNMTLSKLRADSVKARFVEDYGIEPSRVTTVGFGESKPVADNNTRAGREKNRRSIAVILRPVPVTE